MDVRRYKPPKELPAADKLAIEALVAEATAEPVLHIQLVTDDSAKVRCGWIFGPKCGHGTSFELMRLANGWQIASKSGWIA